MPGESAWEDAILGDLAHVEMGQSPPSAFVSDVVGDGLPFLQGNAEFTERYPRPRLWCRRPAKRAAPGSALISVRAPVGAINRADQEYCIGRGLAGIAFRGLNPEFGYHALAVCSRQLARVAQGTTFQAVGGTELRALSFPHPPRPEQRRIAEILDTLDEDLRRTEQVIAKLQQMKQGLLNDLLTRGIDENGELRDPSGPPDQFKDSALGQVPRDWDVRPVEQLCTAIADCPHSTPNYIPEGIPCVRTADIVPGQLLLDQAYRVSEATYRSRTVRLDDRPGDIIFSREGERLGMAAPVGPERVCMGQRVMQLRPAPTVDPTFMVWAMNAQPFYRQVLLAVGSTTSPHVNVRDVRALLLHCPPPAEQARVGASLRAHVAAIRAESRTLAKMRHIKQGLMDDLLAGRVRVQVPESARP